MKSVKCYRLISGDVVRYSNDCLVESYSYGKFNNESHYFVKQKTTSIEGFYQELAHRDSKYAISNALFQRTANKVLDAIALRESQRLGSSNFRVPGGAASRYHHSSLLIERIRINGTQCSYEVSTNSAVSFNSFLSSCSNQYTISDKEYDTIKSMAAAVIDPQLSGLENLFSQKIQMEMF